MQSMAKKKLQVLVEANLKKWLHSYIGLKYSNKSALGILCRKPEKLSDRERDAFFPQEKIKYK